MRVLFALIAALALPLSACAQSVPPADEQWRAISVEAEAAALGDEEIGQLRFLGGVALRSEAAAFGGISDIHIAEDGAFIAITDAGFFMRGALALDETGAPISVSDVAIGAMRDEEGEIFPNKESADAEGLAMLADGRVAVSFEGAQIVRIYDLRDGPFAPAQAGPPLDGADDLPANGGLEAVAPMGDDALLIGAEDNGQLWIAQLGDADSPGPVATLADLPVGYGLVELDQLPDGDFVALQRFYAPVIGNRIRVLRLSTGSLRSANARATTTELARFARPMAIDNFEGVSVVQRGERTLLYLVSDDNFNASQRTLIYAFELIEAEEAP